MTLLLIFTLSTYTHSHYTRIIYTFYTLYTLHWIHFIHCIPVSATIGKWLSNRHKNYVNVPWIPLLLLLLLLLSLTHSHTHRSVLLFNFPLPVHALLCNYTFTLSATVVAVTVSKIIQQQLFLAVASGRWASFPLPLAFLSFFVSSRETDSLLISCLVSVCACVGGCACEYQQCLTYFANQTISSCTHHKTQQCAANLHSPLITACHPLHRQI